MAEAPVLLLGAQGLLGRALCRALQRRGVGGVVEVGRDALDLRDQAAVHGLFERVRPKTVILAAAKVGGIAANIREPASFILDNLLIQTIALNAALLFEVPRLLCFGSSCMYPANAPNPLQESSLFSGPPEATNAPYAVAKRAAAALVESLNAQHKTQYLFVIPPNLYGPFDHFDPVRSHVIPALLLKVYEAKTRGEDHITLWGTGAPRREFLYVDDLADACHHLLWNTPTVGVINVGSNADISILALARLICEVTGFEGQILTDPTAPEGVRAKRMDSQRALALGCAPKVGLREGLTRTWQWFLASKASTRPAPSEPSPEAASETPPKR